MLFIKAIQTSDDPETRQERCKTDRFAAFRSVFKRLNETCANNISPDDYAAIDETFYPIRGGFLFKAYKSKSWKFKKTLSLLYHSVYRKPVEMIYTHIKDTFLFNDWWKVTNSTDILWKVQTHQRTGITSQSS